MNLTGSVTVKYYIDAVVESVQYGDFIPGVGKTFVFGFIAGIVGAYKGFTATGGTEGVGKASTTSVVIASLLILIFDMILVRITLWLWPVV
jgi:phospholipid/cholesterol/gamma-HCH transport system permease protein